MTWNTVNTTDVASWEAENQFPEILITESGDVLTTESGLILITGVDRPTVWGTITNSQTPNWQSVTT